jgi:flavin-dependent dehydrogenase
MTGQPRNRITIIGGGLAGLTCAIHLLKYGFEVSLIEKQQYPKHKVCGEYISNEVLPYLNWLEIDVTALHPTSINHFELSSPSGKVLGCALPLGGFGISRFALDHFLWELARQRGCNCIQDTVTSVKFLEDRFELELAEKGMLHAEIVLGAFGKRSLLDQKLSRPFLLKKSPWLAVKGHYSGSFRDNLVALHNFQGGYCGASMVEGDRINICYLTDYKSFKAYKNIQDFQENVLYKNPRLKHLFENSTPLFDQPLTISQVSFAKKEPVYAHMLMIGDTAGLIHPLCGNGMAMAIHSAKIAAELLLDYRDKRLANREELESAYEQQWNAQFRGRLRTAHFLSGLIRKEKLFKPLLNLLVKYPAALPAIVRRTHGKPF